MSYQDSKVLIFLSTIETKDEKYDVAFVEHESDVIYGFFDVYDDKFKEYCLMNNIDENDSDIELIFDKFLIDLIEAETVCKCENKFFKLQPHMLFNWVKDVIQEEFHTDAADTVIDDLITAKERGYLTQAVRRINGFVFNGEKGRLHDCILFPIELPDFESASFIQCVEKIQKENAEEVTTVNEPKKPSCPRRQIPVEIVDTLLQKYNHKCGYCGKKVVKGNNSSIDHKIPLSKGGNNKVSNLLPCCRTCNSLKMDMDVEQFRNFVFFEIFDSMMDDRKFRLAAYCDAIMRSTSSTFYFERVDKKLKKNSKYKKFDEITLYTSQVE